MKKGRREVKRRRRPSTRFAGASFVEILVAVLILVSSMIPIVQFYTRVSEVPAMSEDKTNAEILASRVLERYGSLGYEELAKLAGTEKRDVLEELFATDKKEGWYGDHPRYARNLGIRREYFKGRLVVRELAPGLLSLDAVVRWSTANRGAKPKTVGTFALTRLVARADLGVASVKGEPEL